MIIRKEITSDSEAIDSVTAAAFMTLAISRHTEPFIIRALRAAGALTLSLVAEDEGGRRRAYRLFARRDFRWDNRLVRNRPRFRSARASETGHWNGAHQPRDILDQRKGRSRLRPRGRPELL